ncbi:hypothetical protein [Anditalea andensis]|uniref:PKD domain-containing protein n=1 Tax=Anditalea andensis TaxID=1048983 RepID=A0A074L4Y2_9BACT|nr:hypothetical protein [Anditalea andensis]KEO75535.1 hypothetical protein EL17_01420 [Anditalea andensis]
MKKQIYLIPILFLAFVGHMMAQTTPIATYAHFDEVYSDPDLLVQMTFCETTEIELTVDESQNIGAPFMSFEWFLLNADGTEPNESIQAGDGDLGRNLNYVSTRTGYQIYRVYGYSVEGQTGCYEMTDIAVYVLPTIPLEPQDVEETYCTTDATPIVADGTTNSLGLGAIILNAEVDQTPFPDTYALNYVWSKSFDGGPSVDLDQATEETYIIGSATNDDHTEVGTHTYSVRISYVVNDGGCEVSETMAVITVTPAPEKPVINVTGGHSRQTAP